MLLTLRAQSRSGQPLGQTLSADFSIAGGSIGRSKECDLVLEDPGQIISRTHASIVYRDGHFYLADMGSNASMINDRVLGIGKEEKLSDGDRIRIGDYVLEASIENESKESHATAPWPSSSPPFFMGISRDETERSGPTSASNDEISEAPILKDAGWPEGNDIFDFGLTNPGPANDSHAAERDDVPPEKVAFVSRQEISVAGRAEQFVKRLDAAPAERAARDFGVTEIFGPAISKGRASPACAPGKPPAVQAHGTEIPGAASAGSSLPPVDQPAVVSDSEVLRALLRGMGLPELQLKKSAVEAAEQIGAMLREATSGTMSALQARTLTKQESRIGVTVIAARENNPLKFFPDAGAALALMLNSTAPGYLKPVQAYAEAFSDLRTHEMAVLAGMQAALSSVLVRFDPVTIEHGMTDAGLLDKLLPTHRKARMWDRMVELYREVSSEADHDFQRLFGERFAEAYEEQVRVLREAKKDCS